MSLHERQGGCRVADFHFPAHKAASNPALSEHHAIGGRSEVAFQVIGAGRDGDVVCGTGGRERPLRRQAEGDVDPSAWKCTISPGAGVVLDACSARATKSTDSVCWPEKSNAYTSVTTVGSQTGGKSGF